MSNLIFVEDLAVGCTEETNTNSLVFDGVNDHALITGSQWGSLSDCTLNFWWRLDAGALATVNNRPFHCRKSTWDANNRFYIDFVRENHGTRPGWISSTMQISGTKEWNWFWDTSAIDLEETWRMLTFVFGNSGDPKLYIDKTLITTITKVNTGTTTKCFDDMQTASIDDYYFGVRYNNDVSSFDFGFDGNMSKWSVWDKQLNQTEINELQCNDLPVDPTTHSASGNLAFYYQAGDGTRDTGSVFSDDLDQSAPFPTDGTLVNGASYTATAVS